MLALIECVLLVLQAAAPTVEVDFKPAEMVSDGGFAVMAPVQIVPSFPFRLQSDTEVGGANLVMREDGHLLEPSHALHRDIRDLGGGRFSYYGINTVRFSASDGSDPRTNGRRYTGAFREVVSPKLARNLHTANGVTAGLLLLAALARLSCAAARRRKELMSVAGNVLARAQPFFRDRRLWCAAVGALGGLIILAQVAFYLLQVVAPTVNLTFIPTQMASDSGLAVVVPLEASTSYPFRLSSDAEASGSSLVLLENGHLLGPAHVLHQEIRDLGAGRYSHWQDTVRFSASDGSDPRSNGRRYTAVVHETIDPNLATILQGGRVLELAFLAISASALLYRLAKRPMGVLVADGLSFVAKRSPVPVGHVAKRSALILSASSGWLMGVSAVALVFVLVTIPGLRHVAALVGGSTCMLFLASRVMMRSPLVFVRQCKAVDLLAPIGSAVRVAAVGSVAIFLLLGPVQLYPAPGWADPSIYHGFFSHYTFNLSLGPIVYQAERLPFVLAGIAFFHVLPVEWAYYAMALLPLAVIVLATLSTLSGMADSAVAVSLLVLTVSNSLVIAAVGQGYVSGFMIAATMAGHACLLRSLEQDRIATSSYMAGVWFALAAITNPAVLVLAQASVLSALLVFPAMFQRLPARMAWGMAGSLTIALLLCLFSRGLTGSYDFVSPALNMAAASGGTPFAMPVGRWLPHALRLAYIAIVCGCGIATLLGCSPERAAQRRRAFLLLCWSVAALMSSAGVLLAADVVLGNAFLMFWYYSCYLVVYTIVITGAILVLLLPPRDSVARLAMPVASAAGGTCAIACAVATRDSDPASLHAVSLAIALGIASVGCCWLAGRAAGRGWRFRAATTLVAMVAPVLLVDLNPDTRNAFVVRDDSAHDAAIVSADADRFIYGALDGRKPYFWYSASAYTRATAHPRGWEFSDHGIYPLWFHAPRLYNLLDQIFFNYYPASALLEHEDPDDIGGSKPDWNLILQNPDRRDAVVVLSQDPDDGRRAISRAAELFKSDLQTEDHKVLSRGAVKVDVWVLGISDAGHRTVESEPFRQSRISSADNEKR